MITLEERVTRLEDEFIVLSTACGPRASARAYEALTPLYDKMDLMTERLGRVEHRVSEVDTKVDLFRDEMRAGFAAVDDRFVAIDERFAAIDKRFVAIDDRFDAIDERFVAIDDRLAAIDKRFAVIDERFVAVDKRFAAVDEQFAMVHRRIDKLDDRIGELSTRVDALAASNAAMFQAILERLPEKAPGRS